MTLHTFKNPYAGIRNDNPGDAHRVALDVSKTDIYILRSVGIEPGFVVAATATFIQSIANECRKHNWTLADRDTLIQHIERVCGLCGAGRTESESDTETTPRHDGSGTPPMGGTTESHQVQLPTEPNPKTTKASVKKRVNAKG